MSISSMALSITGIDDRRYWNFIPNDESRCFHLLLIKTLFGNFVYACVEVNFLYVIMLRCWKCVQEIAILF